ncbi:hypothetical protein [Bradyrhizobium sp. USDA 4502]
MDMILCLAIPDNSEKAACRADQSLSIAVTDIGHRYDASQSLL